MDPLQGFPRDKVLMTAIILAVGLGAVVSVFFIVIGQTTFSALYLNPDSIIHASGSSEVYFVYGVKCMEKGTSSYNLEIYAGHSLLRTIPFTLNPGESREEGIKIELPPQTRVPEKIIMRLHMGDKTEETHFWIR